MGEKTGEIVKCYYCSKEIYVIRAVYNERMKNSGIFTCSRACRNDEKTIKFLHEVARQTNLSKYGVDNPSKSDKVKEKIQENRNKDSWRKNYKNTMNDKYGVDNPQQIPSIKEKTSKTNIEKYGNSVAANSKPVREKIILDNMNKYGVEYFFQSEEFKAMMVGFDNPYKFGSNNYKKRFFELYGVENPMHIPEIAEQVQSGFRRYKFVNHKYRMPDGQYIHIMGYESRTLDKLFAQGYKQEDILYRKRDMPEIWYLFEGKRRRYYPDFYIPNKNLVIETKSVFTFELEKEKNELKMQATKDLGFDFWLDIY